MSLQTLLGLKNLVLNNLDVFGQSSNNIVHNQCPANKIRIWKQDTSLHCV